MKHLPLDATVVCQDGEAGKSSDVIINPVTRQISYMVLEEKKGGHIKRLVPIDLIQNTTPQTIQLSIHLQDVAQLNPFEITHFVQDELNYGPEDGYILEPYALPANYEIVEERIPPGQLAVRRGTAVEATDGKVGKIDEFLIDPNDGHITHFILRDRHYLQKQELTLPVTAVDRVENDVVYLQLSKKQVEDLPTVPTQSAGWKDAEVELIVLLFQDVSTAQEALDELKSFKKRGIIGSVRNAAVLVKDEDGNASHHESQDMGAKKGAVFGAITGGLIGLLAGPAGAALGAAAGAATGGAAAKRIDVGLPNDYLLTVEEKMEPGTSVLVAIVEHEWATSIFEGLDSFNGELFKAALTDEIVAGLTAVSQQND